MNDFHGIIFAYSSPKPLRDLVRVRTAASVPFCARYRVIDFALSSLMNAGIRDCGIIMQRDYQSLLDHVGSGKAWDMSMNHGGLRILPPFAMPEFHAGRYSGTMEALNGVAQYVRDIPQKYIILMQGNLCANLDLTDACTEHIKSGAKITAICADHPMAGVQHKYVCDAEGNATKLLLEREGDAEGHTSLEAYIFNKDVLLELMDKARAEGQYLFHKEVMADYMKNGGELKVYVHKGYAVSIRSIETYYTASMEMLDSDKFEELFPVERPVVSKIHEDVSTYYADSAEVCSSLIADSCIIEGKVTESVIASGVTIEKGAELSGCVIMRGCKIGENVKLTNVICDKAVEFPAGTVMVGTRNNPVIIPRNAVI